MKKVIPSISTQSSSQFEPTVPIEPASSAAKDIEFSSVHAQYCTPQYPIKGGEIKIT